jgi:hypothetical protein
MYNQTVQLTATNGFIYSCSLSSEAHVEEATAANGRTAEKQHRSQMMSISVYHYVPNVFSLGFRV